MKKIIYGILAFIGLILFFTGTTSVPSGKKGLVFKLGAVQEQVLDEGFHFKTPFIVKVKDVSIRPVAEEISIGVDSMGAITKDTQTIGSEIVIYYRYNSTKLPEMWRNYGAKGLTDIVRKTAFESFKDIVGGYTIFEISQNKEKIKNQVLEMVSNRTSEYPIVITQLNIINYDWSDAFDKQIEQTMQRAQQVKQKEQEVLISEQEAQKKVKQAEAEKQATITKAEGEKLAIIAKAEAEKEKARLEAEAKALEGEGIRKYNEEIAKSKELEIELRKLEIELLKVQKWNGEYVPTQVWSSTPINFGGSLQGK